MSVCQRVVLVVTVQEDALVKAEQSKTSSVSVDEDKSTELQVSQDDSVAMTVRHGVQHLSKQKPRLLFAQALPVAHVRMHVTIVTRQEGMHTVLANHHVQQTTDVVVMTNSGIGS